MRKISIKSILPIIFIILLAQHKISFAATFNIEEGFVTFATANYFPLLKVLLDSHKAFSTRPIVAFGINADIPFGNEEYPLLIKKRFDVDLRNENIFWQKPKSILYSEIRYGIVVEADDVLNDGIDNLFVQTRLIKNYPLATRHPSDPDNQQNIMKLLGVTKKTMPYVHGHVLFSESCLSFIQEWLKTCIKIGRFAAGHDETILNVLLWKHGATEQLDLFDPYYEFVEQYQKGYLSPALYPEYQTLKAINFYSFHGCKDPKKAREVLNTLLALKKKAV